MNRRQFIQSFAGAALGMGLTRSGAQDTPALGNELSPRIDFHVHLFGVGDGNTGCKLSERQRRHVNYRYFLRLLGLTENGRMDQEYVQRLVTQLRASSMQKAVLQAWDCRYDAQGKPDWEGTTSLYVPNDYLLQIVRQHPDLFIPCASINPRRRDWADELDRCTAAGVRVLKVHPPTMDVDPADLRFRPFYKQCAENNVILMFHTGAEHAADITDLNFCDPMRLTIALDEGCTVIAAHAGMGGFFDGIDFFPGLVELINRHARLYLDTSELGAMIRWRNLPRILGRREVTERAIHGSDFPFPSNGLVFWNRLKPATLKSLLEERNIFERDYRLKSALGFPEAVFRRGAALLESRLPKRALTFNSLAP